MELTVHSLKYTHTKYCKAKKITTEAIEINENKPVQDIEEIVNIPPAKRQPPGLERAVSRIAEAEPIVREPSDDDRAQYILHKKKALMTNRKETLSLLVSSSLPKATQNSF